MTPVSLERPSAEYAPVAVERREGVVLTSVVTQTLPGQDHLAVVIVGKGPHDIDVLAVALRFHPSAKTRRPTIARSDILERQLLRTVKYESVQQEQPPDKHPFLRLVASASSGNPLPDLHYGIANEPIGHQ